MFSSCSCSCACVCACVSAAIAWSLHRDLGFPLDLVDLMLEEKGVKVDRPELDRLIAENHKVRLPLIPSDTDCPVVPSWSSNFVMSQATSVILSSSKTILS